MARFTNYAIVVGANYGDEGKGLITDYLTEFMRARYNARFNGGAQAGHTVEREGKRHVFSTYGAGTFNDVQTVLTPNVVINPFAALKEQEMLLGLGVVPDRLLISRQSPVTTQWDMAINQISEQLRRDARHGSCGLGINETITRHLEGLSVKQPAVYGTLFDENDEWLRWIGKNHFPRRLVKLNIAMMMSEEHWQRELNMYEERASEFRELMVRCKDTIFDFQPLASGPIVYEGAQGLGLDEFMGEFPHVTRSNCGIGNALDHIATQGGDRVTAVYVTRTYLTRHGAGPLKNEMPVENVLGYKYVDETNVTNEYQQNFRYAPLHIPNLVARISKDIARNAARVKDYGMSFTPYIAVTHMNTIYKPAVVVKDGEDPIQLSPEEIVEEIEKQAGTIKVGFRSWSRSSAGVETSGSVKKVLSLV